MNFRETASCVLAASFFASTAMITHAQSADDKTDYMPMTVNVFMETCMKTAPQFTGVDAKFASIGFHQQSYKTWSNSQINANPHIKLTGSGGQACSVSRYNIDPKKTARLVLSSISKSKLSGIKASAKGRRTTITFSMEGTKMILKVEPLMQKFTTITIYKDGD